MYLYTRVHVRTRTSVYVGGLADSRGRKSAGVGRAAGTYFEDYQSLVTCKGSNYPGADWAPFAAPTARLVHPRFGTGLPRPPADPPACSTHPQATLPEATLFRSSNHPFSG